MTDEATRPESRPGYVTVRRRYACPPESELRDLDVILGAVHNLVDLWRADKPITDALYRLARDFEASYNTFAYPHRVYTFNRWAEWRDRHTVDSDVMTVEEPMPAPGPEAGRNQEPPASGEGQSG